MLVAFYPEHGMDQYWISEKTHELLFVLEWRPGISRILDWYLTSFLPTIRGYSLPSKLEESYRPSAKYHCVKVSPAFVIPVDFL